MTADVKDCSVKQILDTTVTLLECAKPDLKPSCPLYPQMDVASEQVVTESWLPQYAWLMSRALMRSRKELMGDNSDSPVDDVQQMNMHISTWSALNSLVSRQASLTKVGTIPLIPAPALEWKTLLTVLKQAHGISAEVVGPDKKTVISSDMGLYKPGKQMQMSVNVFNGIILRPGELHVVMRQLHCIGGYTENSGFDLGWTEADIYCPTTAKQNTEGKYVKRGAQVHITMLHCSHFTGKLSVISILS